MSLVFVSAECVTRDYSELNPSHVIETVDLGSVHTGDSVSTAIRLANSSASDIAYTTTASTSHIEIVNGSGTVEGERIGDTIEIYVNVPQGANTAERSEELIVSTGSGEYRLELTWDQHGPNVEWTPDLPDRMGQEGRNLSSVAEDFGQPYDLWVFEPIAYSGQHGVAIRTEGLPGLRETGGIGDRLNPMDRTHGYGFEDHRIRAVFGAEYRDIRTEIEALNQYQEYRSGGLIVLPGDLDLHRNWALFSEGNDVEPSQYKRTVFCIKRLSKVYALWGLRAAEFRQQMAVLEADLVEVHSPTPASPQFSSPFSVTYKIYSDKPYGYYPSHEGLELLNTVHTSISGSGSGSPDIT